MPHSKSKVRKLSAKQVETIQHASWLYEPQFCSVLAQGNLLPHYYSTLDANLRRLSPKQAETTHHASSWHQARSPARIFFFVVCHR